MAANLHVLGVGVAFSQPELVPASRYIADDYDEIEVREGEDREERQDKMIRQAATCFVTRRGIALHPISFPTTIGAASQRNNNGGVLLRSLVSSSSTSKSNVAVPPAARPTTPPVQPKGKGQEAIEKSERLHAELREVRYSIISSMSSLCFYDRVCARG